MSRPVRRQPRRQRGRQANDHRSQDIDHHQVILARVQQIKRAIHDKVPRHDVSPRQRTVPHSDAGSDAVLLHVLPGDGHSRRIGIQGQDRPRPLLGRGDGQYARPRSHVQYRGAGRQVSFHGFQAEACGGMQASAKGHPRLQADHDSPRPRPHTPPRQAQ